MSLLRLGNYNVPGHELKVGSNMPFKTADASGETNSTDEFDKGTKAKVLSVSLVIKFTDKDDLKRLTRVAEAKTNGERTVYTIANQTANAMGIRQVRFAENFSATEKDGLRAWDVSFSLKEYHSNPERVEQREKKPEAVAQTNDGTATEETRPAETAEATQEPVTGIEKVLKTIDGMLA